MVVWGGYRAFQEGYMNTGGAYDPATDTWTPTSTTGAPLARDLHAAVWTGSGMLVWGGYDGYAGLDTGATYDPASDVWTSWTTAGAPAGRWDLSAVWTGDRIVVWGGYDGAVTSNTGGVYDPVADRWTSTSLVDAPSERSLHSVVWLGGRMVVWGGQADPLHNETALNTGGRYDPVADRWTPTTTTDAPSPRFAHTAVLVGDRMFVWGGTPCKLCTPSKDGASYTVDDGESAP